MVLANAAEEPKNASQGDNSPPIGGESPDLGVVSGRAASDSGVDRGSTEAETGRSSPGGTSTGAETVPRQPRAQQPPIGPRRKKPNVDEYEELGSADIDPNSAYEIWPGSWMCVDCGWEYTTEAFGTPLELQPETFRCPQCGARKRRFAKKLGSKVAITRDTSNLPIFVMSFLGLLAVIAFGVWAANKL